MSNTVIPAGYKSLLGLYDTQKAIGLIKTIFQEKICAALHLKRVTAPLFVAQGSGLNDDLNGVERPVRRDAGLIREKYGLSSPYLLALSRLVPEKRTDLLIEAFRQVKTEKKLVIAGGSSDTDEYMEKLKNMAAGDDRIIFTGFVQGQMLEELYSNAYLYVLPSDIEGMPLSLLEAMSYGNCCLTSDIAECTEVVEDKGELFRQGDADDLRDKLQCLCDSPDRVKRYRDEADDFICSKYDWDDVVEKTLNLYR